MSGYAVSVITPCHNVNMTLLKRAYESLRNQTCGFERVEWIVVMHNCSEHNAAEIEELCKGVENAKTFRVNDGLRRASVPRNYGLKRATGKYIALLDADDYFDTEVFEVAIRHFERTAAELVAFRYEVVLASPDISVDIRPLVFFDQTQKEIIFERGDGNSALYINGEAMNLGSKMYLRSFLEKNNIRFDETIPYAEEGKFHLECYGKANRLCFLPQYIGFYYCRYADSMTGMLKKTPDQVLNYAWGFKKIFDCGLAHDLYMNTYMWDLIGLLSAIMLASMNMAYRDRKKVAEVMKPYLAILKPQTPNKVNTAAKLKLISTLVSIVMCHPRLVSGTMCTMKLFKVDMAEKIAFNYDKKQL